MQAKADASEELAKKVELEATIAGLDAAAKILADARDVALELIPNELDPSVPVSNDEKDNIVVRSHGKCRPCEPGLLHHNEILWMIDGYEDKRGSALAGHRGYFLKGPGVLLNQASRSPRLSLTRNLRSPCHTRFLLEPDWDGMSFP